MRVEPLATVAVVMALLAPPLLNAQPPNPSGSKLRKLTVDLDQLMQAGQSRIRTGRDDGRGGSPPRSHTLPTHRWRIPVSSLH
jgi:hypothetical protein